MCGGQIHQQLQWCSAAVACRVVKESSCHGRVPANKIWFCTTCTDGDVQLINPFCAMEQSHPVAKCKKSKIIEYCESRWGLGTLQKVLADEWTLLFSRNSWRIHQMRSGDKYHMNSWWPWFVWRSTKALANPKNTSRRGQMSRPAALVRPTECSRTPHCPQWLHNFFEAQSVISCVFITSRIAQNLNITLKTGNGND